MAMRVHPAVSTVIFISLALLITVGPRGRAVAESACIDQPDRDAPEGEHWYYHFDREKDRKCWHRGPAAVVHELPALPRIERTTRSFSSTLNSMLGQAARGVRNFFRQPMPHEPARDEPRIVQSDATRPLTIEDIAQQPELYPEERAESRPASALTLAQRRALFEEFLKWQRTGGGSGDASVQARSP
jgi:hypothetical protein